MRDKPKYLCACGHGTEDENAMWDHLKAAHGGSGHVANAPEAAQ